MFLDRLETEKKDLAAASGVLLIIWVLVLTGMMENWFMNIS